MSATAMCRRRSWTTVRLRITRDAVLQDMLRGLGAETQVITAPFHPEGGAYATLAAGHHHGHD